MHSKYSYTVRIDIKDFFPSIKPTDLFYYFDNYCNTFILNNETKDFLKNILFIKPKWKEWGLAIGAPSSPQISNIVMFELDNKISNLAKGISAESTYTRYSDDILFSTSIKNGCREFFNQLKHLLSSNDIPNLRINNGKTIFSSRGTKRNITGLIITPFGNISIGRNHKRYIKKLLYDFNKSKLDVAKIKYLHGYLAFILDNEPAFYNRLVIKYGEGNFSKIHSLIHPDSIQPIQE